MSENAFTRLRDDLNRPAGGWTMGFLTLIGTLLAPLLGAFGIMHQFVATGLMMGLFIIHISWGLHGYYPRRV